MRLSDVCLMYGLDFEKIKNITQGDFDGSVYNNGINDFFTIENDTQVFIIKLNGEKRIYCTKEFPSPCLIEYFDNGEVIASHCANEDGTIDFIFDYISERAINFFVEEL